MFFLLRTALMGDPNFYIAQFLFEAKVRHRHFSLFRVTSTGEFTHD